MGSLLRRRSVLWLALIALAVIGLVLLMRQCRNESAHTDETITHTDRVTDPDLRTRRLVGPSPDADAAQLTVHVPGLAAGDAPTWECRLLTASTARDVTHDGAGPYEGVGPLRIAGVAPGTTFVLIKIDGYGIERGQIEIEPGKAHDLTLDCVQLPTVRGRVLIDGEAAAGAVVRIEGGRSGTRAAWVRHPPDSEVTSADDGTYELRNLHPATQCRLLALHEACPPWKRGDVDLDPGATLTIDIEMTRGARLRGALHWRDESPVLGGRVNVLHRDASMGAHVMMVEAQTNTKTDGTFLTPGLVPGELKIVRAVLRRDDGIHILQARVDAPGAGVTKDIGIVRPHGSDVTWHVTLPTGEDPTEYSLTIATNPDDRENDFGIALATLALSAEGTLRVDGLGIGTVDFNLVDGRGVSVLTERATIRDDIVTIDVDVPAHEAANPPAVTGTVHVTCDRPGAWIGFIDGDWRIRQAAVSPPVDANVDVPLPPASYDVVAMTPDGWTDGSVLVEEDGHTSLTLDSWQPGEALRVFVVRLGEPVADAAVWFRGFLDDRGEPYRYLGKTDKNGQLEFRGIPPGAPGVKLHVTHGRDSNSAYVETGEYDGVVIEIAK